MVSCRVDGCGPVAGKVRLGLCEKHYRRLQRTGKLSARLKVNGTIDDRIKAYSMSDPVTGCVLWTGSRSRRDGYARLKVNANGSRETISVPRYLLGLAKGDAREACHTCDNPPCIRRDHLFAASHAANMADASRKGRMLGRRAG